MYLSQSAIISIFIQLRKQIQQMKEKSGLKDIYQSNPHRITPGSLQSFLHMAQIHMCDVDIPNNHRYTNDNDQVEDIEVLGIQKLKKIVKEEWRKQIPSQFLWGSTKERNTDLDEFVELIDQ